ncbi:cell wall binding repeat family protein [Paenibacillus amylolyticus]|uniref:Cell wall binding repeat family protein n=2 Tax=Paenibacillus amylolyticus TaxID=1451 RepID=A0A100VHS9_PAEAM|nr:cell wall binding repeat family protein [Paenibacillus amylolyticus]
MFENIVSDGIKSFSRLRNYMGKTNKKKSFNSPAISTIHKIVSRNAMFKPKINFSENKNSKFLKKNKNFNKLLKGTGSLIKAVANQKSYHTGPHFNSVEKKKDASVGDKLNFLWNKSASGVKSATGWTKDKANFLWNKSVSGVKNAIGWTGDKANFLWNKSASGVKSAIGWTGDKANFLWNKSVSGVKSAIGWTGDKANFLWNKSVSGVKNAIGWTGDKANFLWNKSVSGVKGATGWTKDKANFLWNKSASGVKSATGWTGDKANFLWNKSVSGVKSAIGWTGDKANFLWNKSVSGVKGATGWTKDKANFLWNKSASGVKSATGWTKDKANFLWNKSVSGVKGAIGWTGDKANFLWDKSESAWNQLTEWYKDIDFKKKFNNFFKVTSILNYIKDFGEKSIEFGKKKGWGIHPKIENMWSSPFVKKIRMFGKRAFPFLDIGSSINDVVQAPTPDEKIIAFSKALLGKLGSIGGAAAGTFFGSLLPAQPATVPAFAYLGSLGGEWGGKIIGGLAGQGLTKVWPKTWWPYKKEKTSKINPTKNLNLNKGKTQNLVGSINKTSPSQRINVTLPTGAIQISNGSNKVDYNGMVAQISAHFVKELRKAMENRKTIMA